MSRSQMKQTFRLLKKDGETFATYYREEVERCRALLARAMETAATDHCGKPIIYTISRHVSASGLSHTISVHYFDTADGAMRHLNYVAAVLLDRPQDPRRDGVICKGGGMDMGFGLVYALAHAATDNGYAAVHHWL